MLALPMTLNTTAETETARIARGLRERDMELLADLVERCQHRLLPSSGPSPFEAAARSEDAIRLAGQLQILSPLYREALLLRFQEDLSLPEIAQVLGPL